MYFDAVIWIYFGMFGLIFLWAGWLAWSYKKLPEFAGEVYDSNIEKELLTTRISRDDFIEIYTRSEWPRSAAFRCATAFVSLLLVPILITVFNQVWDAIWNAMGSIPGPFESGYMLHTFMTFLAVMGAIVGLLYLVTAFKYRTAPPTLAQEIRRLEGELE